MVTTSYGVFDTVPQPGETIIPSNMGNGPAAVAVNLRIGRSWGIGPKLAAAGGDSGGFGPGGFGGGGRGGPGGPGGASTGHKYSLNFNVQALNLFNDIDYGTPIGTVIPGSTRFGQSTSLAGGIFSSGAAARRIFFQASFQF